jgi:hypothetical protein
MELSVPDQHGPLDGRAIMEVMPDLTKEEKKLPVDERLAARFEKLGVKRSAVKDEDLVRMYTAKKWIESFLDDVEEYLSGRAEQGNAAPGTKLVLGREGNRKWGNDEAADTFLKGQGLSADERYEKKLISPTEAEKLLKDKLKATKRTATRFEELVTRAPAKNVLALSDDKREAVPALSDLMPNEDIIDI